MGWCLVNCLSSKYTTFVQFHSWTDMYQTALYLFGVTVVRVGGGGGGLFGVRPGPTSNPLFSGEWATSPKVQKSPYILHQICRVHFDTVLKLLKMHENS